MLACSPAWSSKVVHFPAFYRKRSGITQEKLSESVGVNNVHISHIETGDRAASLDLLFAIADELGMEPYKLFQAKE